jgi:hypothetical protein
MNLLVKIQQSFLELILNHDTVRKTKPPWFYRLLGIYSVLVVLPDFSETKINAFCESHRGSFGSICPVTRVGHGTEPCRLGTQPIVCPLSSVLIVDNILSFDFPFESLKIVPIYMEWKQPTKIHQFNQSTTQTQHPLHPRGDLDQLSS